MMGMKKRMKRGGTAKKKRAKAMGGGMMKKRMKLGGSAQTTKKPGRKSKKMVDLSGDGKITKKDILIGRGVIKKPAGPKGMKKGGSAGKDTHVTKDGRTVKKGLYYYMNRAKKRGTSRKGKGTVTDKALKRSAKTAKKA
jgi:hypothetical protein|tara:strand:+ start:1630 stop:2046 length:417 start_codon:yes stop_codon:yes gene_type:complete